MKHNWKGFSNQSLSMFVVLIIQFKMIAPQHHGQKQDYYTGILNHMACSCSRTVFFYNFFFGIILIVYLM